MNKSEYQEIFEQIVADSTLTDLEKLVRSFDLVTREFIGHYQHDAELARAMGDKETAVREEIKAGILNASRGMFAHCYTHITGLREKLWDE
jgi:hypothetical protein